MTKITPKHLKLEPHPPQGAVLTAKAGIGREYSINIGRDNLRGLGQALLQIADRFDQEPRPVFPKRASYSEVAGPDLAKKQAELGQSPMRFEIGVDESLSLVALRFHMRDPQDSQRVVTMAADMVAQDAEVMIVALRQAISTLEPLTQTPQ